MISYHPTPSLSPRDASCLDHHLYADSKGSFHGEEETRQTHCSCCCRILRGPPCFSQCRQILATKLSPIFLSVLAAVLLHIIRTFPQNSRRTRRETVEFENTKHDLKLTANNTMDPDFLWNQASV